MITHPVSVFSKISGTLPSFTPESGYTAFLLLVESLDRELSFQNVFGGFTRSPCRKDISLPESPEDSVNHFPSL